MIRLILFGIGAIFISIASAFTYPIYAVLKRINRSKADHFALAFVKFGFSVFLFMSGVKCIYKGLENLPEDGEAVLFASNHRSLFDAMLSYKAFKGITGNLSKKELKKLPIIGWWIRSIYGVLLDRNDHTQGLRCVQECVRYINQGISILAYPEGTRGHEEGKLNMFHRGTFKIATIPGVPIVPVAINGTGDIFDDHRPYIKAHTAVVEFCKPIETKNLSKEELNVIQDTVQEIIQEKLISNAPDVK